MTDETTLKNINFYLNKEFDCKKLIQETCCCDDAELYLTIQKKIVI